MSRIRHNSRISRLALALGLAACGKSSVENPPASGSASASASSASASGAPEKSPKAPTGESGDQRDRFCKRVDRDALATLVGVPTLSRTGGGSLVKGGSGPSTLSCSYYEGGKIDGGLAFGFRLSSAKELEKQDALGRFQWEPYDGLGQPAQIGRSKKGIHLQTLANGARLVVDLEHPTIALGELEPRAVAATKAVIAELPADATIEVR